jgi:hypothetical protein
MASKKELPVRPIARVSSVATDTVDEGWGAVEFRILDSTTGVRVPDWVASS